MRLERTKRIARELVVSSSRARIYIIALLEPVDEGYQRSFYARRVPPAARQVYCSPPATPNPGRRSLQGARSVSRTESGGYPVLARAASCQSDPRRDENCEPAPRRRGPDDSSSSRQQRSDDPRYP